MRRRGAIAAAALVACCVAVVAIASRTASPPEMSGPRSGEAAPVREAPFEFVSGTVEETEARATATEASTGVVAGRVVGPVGPLAGIVVDVGGTCVETDADGRFRVEGIGPGSPEMEITAPGFAPRRWDGYRTRVRPGDVAEVGDIRLEPLRFLEGTVLDDASVPVPGARVTVISAMFEDAIGGFDSWSGESDARGRFRIRCPSSLHDSLRAECPGHLPRGSFSFRRGPSPRARPLVVRLLRTGRVRGRVVLDAGGAPEEVKIDVDVVGRGLVPPSRLQDGRRFPFRRARNARGDLVVPLDPSPFPRFGGLADDDGRFDHEVPPGEYHVVALADGAFSEMLPVTVPPGEAMEVELSLRPPRSASARCARARTRRSGSSRRPRPRRASSCVPGSPGRSS